NRDARRLRQRTVFCNELRERDPIDPLGCDPQLVLAASMAQNLRDPGMVEPLELFEFALRALLEQGAGKDLWVDELDHRARSLLIARLIHRAGEMATDHITEGEAAVEQLVAAGIDSGY